MVTPGNPDMRNALARPHPREQSTRMTSSAEKVDTGREMTAHINLRGKRISARSAVVNGTTVVVTGKWLKMASIWDEDWQDTGALADPMELIANLQRVGNLHADIFRFTQALADSTPRFSFVYEWESVAAIPLHSYSDWWTSRISTDVRKDVRRAAKRGVTVRNVPFTDEFVRAVVSIYDETPIRQGRAFWHYKTGFDAVKQATGTYRERSTFLGAFLNDELIGFAKIVYVGSVARLMQIISKEAHREARPNNALIAEAVEVCAKRGCSYLTYGNYRYAQGIDSMTEFKRRNGFDEVLVPRYYAPLTLKGRMALKLGLYQSIRHMAPRSALVQFRKLRKLWYDRQLFPKNS
jgi:hypothetical protein